MIPFRAALQSPLALVQRHLAIRVLKLAPCLLTNRRIRAERRLAMDLLHPSSPHVARTCNDSHSQQSQFPPRCHQVLARTRSLSPFLLAATSIRLFYPFRLVPLSFPLSSSPCLSEPPTRSTATLIVPLRCFLSLVLSASTVRMC